jgi:hypothetical protein
VEDGMEGKRKKKVVRFIFDGCPPHLEALFRGAKPSRRELYFKCIPYQVKYFSLIACTEFFIFLFCEEAKSLLYHFNK